MRQFITSILLLAVASVSSAKVQVEARIDSMEILIGEQTRLTLTVNMQQGDELRLPSYEPMQQLTPGVEVLEMSPVDTARLDNDGVRVSRTYTLTSFDEDLYYLPPMTVTVNGSEYHTQSLALKVLTVAVDTLHPERFYPPKDVQDNPFSWAEWKPLFLLSLLMIVVLCLTIYLYVRLRDNKPIITIPKIVKRVLPHQRAMKEIEKIKAEHMTASENQKEYYTRLTDTLRKYIEERFGFSAMEMTSSEIIDRLRQDGDSKTIAELRELFTTADLVKFAKYSALINENDANLIYAIEFINTTKIETPPDKEADKKPRLTEADRRSLRSRVVIKVVIALGCIIAAVLLVYVVYQAYALL